VERFFVTVAIPRPLDQLYSYEAPPELVSRLLIGSWVEVPFGRGKTHAFVVQEPKPWSELPSELRQVQLKPIVDVGPSETIIPKDVWDLCLWASKYYHQPLGEVLHCAVPAASLGLKSVNKNARAVKWKHSEEPVLNPLTLPQEKIFEEIMNSWHRGDQRPCLLHGITGSGKTEVYLHLAREILGQGKSVLVLVPEIALTPQLNQRFEKALGVKVAAWHSALADGARRDLAFAMRQGEARVVVGAGADGQGDVDEVLCIALAQRLCAEDRGDIEVLMGDRRVVPTIAKRHLKTLAAGAVDQCQPEEHFQRPKGVGVCGGGGLDRRCSLFGHRHLRAAAVS
jgi:primosomal protein N' (replication factor Y)